MSRTEDIATNRTAPRARGLASYLFGRRAAPTTPREREPDSIQALTVHLIEAGRYALALRAEAADEIDDTEAEAAWLALESRMALVPGGGVPIVLPDGSTGVAPVAAYFLDRHAVTNEQFRQFVSAGGYEDLELWPRPIWPTLLRFTDRTGRAGPRAWEAGTFPAPLAHHPVVGVSWHEAAAYARWVGKRLPTAAEWQKAAGWPEHLGGGRCRRYPWGDAFAQGRANLGPGGMGRTASVGAFAEGATSNGIYQLIGNVWEWLDDPLEAIPGANGESLASAHPLRRIAGGAFDTYLVAEAAVPFVTGQPDADRRDNIGFRCALTASRLRALPDRDDSTSPEGIGSPI